MTRKRKTIKKPIEPIKKGQTYSVEALLNTDVFGDNYWLATVVLDKSKKYTPEEAQAFVQARADRKAV